MGECCHQSTDTTRCMLETEGALKLSEKALFSKQELSPAGGTLSQR